MKNAGLLLCIVLLAVCTSGCFRLKREYESFGGGGGFLGMNRNYWTPRIVKERFYGGLRENIDSLPRAKLFLPFNLIDLPLELIADTLLLPKDLLLYGDYVANPPLALLVSDNKYNIIKERLENGEQPDAMDGRIYDSYAVERAIRNGNVAIYTLLLEYGATTHAPYRTEPNSGLFSSHSSGKRHDRNTLANAREIIRLAFERDGEKAQMDGTGGQLFTWCDYLTDTKRNFTLEELEDCVSIVEMLLQHGASANYDFRKQTTLDIVQTGDSLPPQFKERLVSALRRHGGLTHEELSAKIEAANADAKPAARRIPMYPQSTTFASQLEKEPIAIDPMFNKVVEFLKGGIQTGHYRISNSFRGLSCPVLVVESGYPDAAKNNDIIFRRKTKFHRRTGPTSWSMQSEEFEFPSCERLVFTPPGVIIPSRIEDDMPKFLLNEAWLSLPDCECYCERNPHMRDRHFNWSLQALAANEGIDKAKIINKECSKPNILYFNNLYTTYTSWPFKISQADKTTMELAKQASEVTGLKGVWSKILCYQGRSEYVFTTHGRSPADVLERRCPYPDEIFCILDVSASRPVADGFFQRMNNRNPKLKKTTQLSLESMEGRSYWNYASVFIPKRFSVSIFFGDEVPPSTVEKLQKSLSQKLK